MSAYAGPLETDLEPDDYVMFQFLEWWFEKCNHGAIELCWRDPVTGGWHLIRRFGLDDINAAARFAAETNAHRGCSIYFRPATVRFDTLHTTDADVVQIPGLWGDHDTAAAVDRMRAIQCLRPSAEIITGRIPVERVQSMFKLSGDPILIGEWSRTLNRQVQKLYDSDPAVVNPSSLMRLPGSIAWPWKEGREPELTEWVTPDGGGATWTLDALRAALPAVEAEAAPGRLNGQVPAGTSTSELLNPTRALIEQAKAGPVWHDPVLRLVAMLVARGTPPCVIEAMAPELTWPGYTVQQTRAELATMIAGAHRKGFAPEQDEFVDGTDDPTDVEADVMDVPPPATSTAIQILTEDDLEAMPNPIWLIDELLVADSLCVLYGPWGSFKSFIALHIALCLVTDSPFLGMKVVRSDVLYIAGEGASGIKKRLAAWKKHHGVARTPGFRVVAVAVNLLDRGEAERLILAVLEAHKADGFNPKLVIVDTLHRAMPGGDENAAKEMGIVLANGAHIQRRLGSMLMPVHHSGKDFERGMRGSTGLPGGSDTILRMTRDGTGDRGTLLVEKQKDGEDGQEYHVISRPIDLPPSSGSLKPCSSLVLIQDDEPPSTAAGKLTKAEWKAKQFLADLLVAEGAPLPSGSGFPSPVNGQQLRGVREERWAEECEQRRLSTADQKKARNQTFRRAFANLHNRNEVAARGGLVWLVR